MAKQDLLKPKLDLTTCECRITKGEMVRGQGPFARDAEGMILRDQYGVEQREASKYRIAKNDDNTDRNRIVCDTDDVSDIEKCHVELTIERD